MTNIAIVLFVAVVVEGVVEYLKLSFPTFAESKWVILATIVLGIGLSVAFDVDIFALSGYASKIPYIGNVITGVLISRGSNYMYDLIGNKTEEGIDL